MAEMRPRDINLCVGLGNKRDKLNLLEYDGQSTFSQETANDGHADFSSKPQRLKKILTLSEVHEKYCDPKQEIHFCKIDVEGFEKEVLEGIKDWEKFRPWIFVIEATLPIRADGIPCYELWEPMLFQNDYKLAFTLGGNKYYVAMEREYLLQGFSEINKFVAQNEIVIMNMYSMAAYWHNFCKMHNFDMTMK